MVFPFSVEMLSEVAVGTLELSGAAVERTIHSHVRIQRGGECRALGYGF